jgi:hypothetical protein
VASNLFTAYENDKFSGKIEVKDGLAFFHVDSSEDLNRSDIKEAREVFSHIKKAVLDSGYERLYAFTPRPHFARLLGPGFIHIETIPHEDTTYELIVWELAEET